MRVKVRKPPTPQSIARHVARLMADLHAVYGERKTIEKTNERGTVVIRWRTGRAVIQDAYGAKEKVNATDRGTMGSHL